LDRIRGRLRLGERRPRRRQVPGGDPAAYVKRQVRSEPGSERESEPGRIRLELPARQAERRIPRRHAGVEPDGEDACIVTTRGAWSRSFLVWMALLDEPMEVLGPPALVEAAQGVLERLGHSVKARV
jgi:hypothetical protein